MKNKVIFTALGAVLFAVVVFALFAQFGADMTEPKTTDGSFSQSLWSDYAWAAVIIGIIIFAGALGVLKLVGGEFRWR